jgi:hypothetical protein
MILNSYFTIRIDLFTSIKKKVARPVLPLPEEKAFGSGLEM